MHIAETEAMYCLFLISLLVISSTASDHQINITKNYEMEELLCSGTQLLNDTTVKLSTNIHHFIHNAPYCIMNTTYSLSIISNSSQQAVIHCNDSITRTKLNIKKAIGHAACNAWARAKHFGCHSVITLV